MDSVGDALPGAKKVSSAQWIEVRPVQNQKEFLAAPAEGLQVRGTVGLLEMLYREGHYSDLRSLFQQLATLSYIEDRLLNQLLRSLKLSPL
jgi:hypothetical protein